jgi:hypothetical protein
MSTTPTVMYVAEFRQASDGPWLIHVLCPTAAEAWNELTTARWGRGGEVRVRRLVGRAPCDMPPGGTRP